MGFIYRFNIISVTYAVGITSWNIVIRVFISAVCQSVDSCARGEKGGLLHGVSQVFFKIIHHTVDCWVFVYTLRHFIGAIRFLILAPPGLNMSNRNLHLAGESLVRTYLRPIIK